jgi:hypothetical protein
MEATKRRLKRPKYGGHEKKTKEAKIGRPHQRGRNIRRPKRPNYGGHKKQTEEAEIGRPQEKTREAERWRPQKED